MSHILILVAVLSTGVEIPEEGVPAWEQGHQYTTRMEKHPEKYENLQVRVAGWNIRWNDIPRKEQDEYIRRIETVGGGL